MRCVRKTRLCNGPTSYALAVLRNSHRFLRARDAFIFIIDNGHHCYASVLLDCHS